MPRPIHRAVVEARPDLMMALRVGPTVGDGVTEEALRIGWECHGERVMEMGRMVGTRPWGWWMFVAGQEPPRTDLPNVDWHFPETVRLAELGKLTADELAALREEANEARLRIGTDSERISGGWRKHGVSMDQHDVDLWEAVERARRRA